MGTLRSVRIRIGRAEKVVEHNRVDRSIRDGASSANDASDGRMERRLSAAYGTE